MRVGLGKAVLAGAAVLSVVGLGGCTSSGPVARPPTSGQTTGFNEAVDTVLNRSGVEGGTLELLAMSDCDSWDPARTSYSWCLDMQRVLSRTLVNYSKVNGASFRLAPDLATDLGTHNAGFTEWKYTLRKDLRYSDGSAITAKDIKYAIERNYATKTITGGMGRYFTAVINAPASYGGPYASGELPDSAITADADSITFHLKKPFADFDYLLALPASAPVSATTDTGARYGEAPISSGPFRISDYTPKNSITFTRNRFWSQSTDGIRVPRVSRIDLAFDGSSEDIDDRLRTGSADARMDSPVGSTFRSQILRDPTLRAHADDPVGPVIHYIAIPATVAPFDNVHCRRAVFYAFNKAGSVELAGGAPAGKIAHSAVPPGVLGYQDSYDPYPSGGGNTGDLVKAAAELRACGKPNGFATKYAYPTPDETGGADFVAVRTALGRVGITVTSATADARDFYSTFVGSPASVASHGLGLINAAWGAEFPTPYGLFQDIVSRSAIRQWGNSNYASIDIPAVNVLLESTDVPSSAATGEALNHALMGSAQFLPIRYSANFLWRNPRLTNVTSNNALGFGAYDVVNVGVSDGR